MFLKHNSRLMLFSSRQKCIPSLLTKNIPFSESHVLNSINMAWIGYDIAGLIHKTYCKSRRLSIFEPIYSHFLCNQLKLCLATTVNFYLSIIKARKPSMPREGFAKYHKTGYVHNKRYVFFTEEMFGVFR